MVCNNIVKRGKKFCCKNFKYIQNTYKIYKKLKMYEELNMENEELKLVKYINDT